MLPLDAGQELRDGLAAREGGDEPAGRILGFTYDDLMRYHGPGFPGGVAHAFKVLERGLPLLDP